MKIYLILLLLPITALASEAETNCQLAKANAEVLAANLVAPSAFVNTGNSVTPQQTLAVGLSESFSGLRKGSLLRQMASAECDSFKATTVLDEQARSAMDEVERIAAKEELSLLNKADDLSSNNIALLTSRFEAHTSSITQLEDARTQRDSIQERRQQLLVIMSKPGTTLSAGNLEATYHEAKITSGHAALLQAKANATLGWDLTLSAGGLKPITSMPGSTMNTQGFVSIGVKYSFGAHASNSAARDVQRLTEQLMDEQGGGYKVALDKERTQLHQLIIVAKDHLHELDVRTTESRAILDSIEGLNSAAAELIKSSMSVKLIVLDADRRGTTSRLTGYQKLLSLVE
jgi:hypothetical protein